MGCCVGVTCRQAIPPKKVLWHHVPGVCIILPEVYFQYSGRGFYYADLHWITAAVSLTSCNEALWVGSSFFSPETLAGKPYRIAHACVTSSVLVQFIGVTTFTCLTHLADDRPLIVLWQLKAMLLSIATIQIHMLVNALTRLGELLEK